MKRMCILLLLMAIALRQYSFAAEGPGKAEASVNEKVKIETPYKADAVAMSRNDAFLQFLFSSLNVNTSNIASPVVRAIDWENLHQKANNATNATVRVQRGTYVEFWKRLAEAHDYGWSVAPVFMFEKEVCQLLTGVKYPEGPPLIYDDLGLPRNHACEYLLNENLPAWAQSLRPCAASVLVGDGDRRGMEVLLEEVRAALKESHRFYLIYEEWLAEVMRPTTTEKALPLLAEAVNDEDPRVRLVFLSEIGRIPSDRATSILLAMLKDKEKSVRTAAAIALMNRNVKESAPILLEKVGQELDGKISSAIACAPICVKLQQWGIAGIPWEKVEIVLNDQVKTNGSDYWLVLEVADCCLAAGREKIALPFLKAAANVATNKIELLSGPGTPHYDELTLRWNIAWRAARILATNGRMEGVDFIRQYFDVGAGDWQRDYEGLMALASFLNRPGTAKEDQQLIMAIAAKAFKQNNERGSCQRILEALAEMGALTRVERHGKHLQAVDVIMLPYDQGYPEFMMAEICRAKLRSFVVSAKQENITLRLEWLANYRKEQYAAIAVLAQALDTNLRNAADAASKELNSSSK